MTIEVGSGSSSTSTVEDIDDDALQQAQAMLGTASPQDTVNQALRDSARREVVARYMQFRAALAERAPDRTTGWR